MTDTLRETLLKQYDTAWKLAQHHLDGLTTDECLWRPAERGLHVSERPDGTWQADWPTHEGYDLGPSSMAWVTWHIGFWWSMVLDHSFAAGALTREKVAWPGTADGVRLWLSGFDVEWRTRITALDDEAWKATTNTHWPFADRPFADVVAWANVELTKNASELGMLRFLHAAKRAP